MLRSSVDVARKQQHQIHRHTGDPGKHLTRALFSTFSRLEHPDSAVMSLPARTDLLDSYGRLPIVASLTASSPDRESINRSFRHKITRIVGIPDCAMGMGNG